MIDTLPELNALSPFESDFLATYKANGYNATLAYHTLKPDVSYNTARTNACLLLQKAHVAAALQAIKVQAHQASTITKDALIRKAATITDKAEDSEQYGPALKGVELQAKLIGAFDDDADAEAKYTNLFQRITINQINISKSETTVSPDKTHKGIIDLSEGVVDLTQGDSITPRCLTNACSTNEHE